MIIIGIDYGDERTGIAVCDKFETLASPVTVIHEYNQDKLISKIIELSSEYKPECFVIGLPKNMDGSVGFRGDKCIEFAEKLSEISGIKCELYDERLTTVNASVYLNMNNVKGKKRKNTVDAVASTIILQNFIDSKRIRGE